MKVNDRPRNPLQRRQDVDRLLHPAGVALVGSVDRTADPDRVLAPHRARWGETFHLVDAAGGRVGGVPVHAAIADVPDPVDLAILAVSRDEILAAVDDCGRRGIRNLIVSTSGFAELGAEGEALERRLVAAARGHGMRVLGPNANANLYDAMPPPVSPRIGKIALVTQSGHMGRVIFQASPHGVAFSRWVPTGNEADLEAADFIEYFAYDDDTAVIAGYFEGFRDGVKLRRALAAAAAQAKPVVVIKVGRQEAASRMASSHTAHLTGADAVVDGLFRQYGVIRVDDVDELIETAALHAKLAPPAGPRVALYGISGGAVALMAEQAESHGVPVPVLAEETQRRLHEVLPAHLGVTNPVDNGNLYRVGTPERRRKIFDLVCEDPSVDLLVCALTGVLPGITDDFAGDILDFMHRSDTPVVVTWNTWEMDSPAYAALVESGVPIFRSFRNCFRALAGYFEHRRRVEHARERPLPESAPALAADGAVTLGPAEAAALLGRHGIPVVRERLVDSRADAEATAAELGFPVVLKAPLGGFPHKSDVGLVVTGLHDAAAVGSAFDRLRTRARELAPHVHEPPLLVQQQVGGGVEVIVGVTRDETLGAAVLVGLGGIFTEVLRDVSVRPVPITPADAAEMLRELRGYDLLEGVRGAARADVEALERVLVAVGRLAADPASRIVELDLNPVLVTPGGAVAVDSLVVVEAAQEPAAPPPARARSAPARA